MTITFIGHGYVGLVSAAVFADLGNTVWVIGHTYKKIENLKKGILPLFEPGLEEIVKRNIKTKRLIFTLDYSLAVPTSSVVFIAVGTPSKKNGETDLSAVFDVAKKIGQNLRNKYAVVVTKSTVPIGTNRKIKNIIAEEKPENLRFDIASVPEFLREGRAISDTLRPDRIIIGIESQRAQDILLELHKPINSNIVLTDIETAEMIKYAANAFLATKISFANAIAHIAGLTNADGLKVLEGIGLDKRIGSKFLSPGAGFGGSCFPKDLKALIAISRQYGYEFELLKDVEKINDQAILGIVAKAKRLLGDDLKNKKIGILGLTFKPDTDDMRDAPSITIIKSLQREKGYIKAYDPIAMQNAKKILKNIEYCKDAYSVAKDSDILIVLTEWGEFRQLDLQKIKNLMRSAIILDGRNIYDPKKAKEMGFIYTGVGR